MNFKKLMLLVIAFSFLFTSKETNTIEINKKHVLKLAKILSGLSSVAGFGAAYLFNIDVKESIGNCKRYEIFWGHAPIEENDVTITLRRNEKKRNMALAVGVLSLCALKLFRNLDK